MSAGRRSAAVAAVDELMDKGDENLSAPDKTIQYIEERLSAEPDRTLASSYA
ncbi:MAG TPA: hypothetical protein VMU19_10115 [Bryobacteraceae bacterium]|nr:hypothetical protein [Bryobacteraceae bacterium]